MDYARNLLQNWIVTEPIAGLWLGTAAALLFGATYSRLKREGDHPWRHGLFAALANAITAVFLLGMIYFLLNSGFNAFNRIYGSFVVGGSISNQAWQQWRNMYGGTYDQKDLQVTQYITEETQEIIPPAKPQDPLLYRDVTVERALNQNNIAGFRGKVNITVNGGHDQKNTINGYALLAEYEYDIFNPSSEEVRTEFRFPVSPDTKLYQDISVLVDTQSVSWGIRDGAIYWEKQMSPNEKNVVYIRFHAWGENSFLFEIPEAREILNFSLNVTLDTDNC